MADEKTTAAIDSVAEKAKEDVATALDGLSQGDISAFLPLIQDYVIPAVNAVILLIVAYFVSKYIARATAKPLKSRVDETVGAFISQLVFSSLMLFTILGVLGMFGISVASFAAVIAAAGFAVGLAFQGTLSNFASGILLLVFRPFKVGDVIGAAGITAKVAEIDLFTTAFNTFDNRRIIVPNSEIAGQKIENITYHQERRVDVNVGAEYSASLDDTRAALQSAVDSLKDLLIGGEERGSQIMLLDLGDSSVNWVVRFWTKASDYWQVKESLTAAVKNELDRAGIGIPYPQMDIHLDANWEAARLKVVGESS
jgi:small conductance mechanosensitive channel